MHNGLRTDGTYVIIAESIDINYVVILREFPLFWPSEVEPILIRLPNILPRFNGLF